MALRKLRFASSRWSAGELTLGELGSVVLWESPDRPRVKRAGLAAMACEVVGRAVERGYRGGNAKKGQR